MRKPNTEQMKLLPPTKNLVTLSNGIKSIYLRIIELQSISSLTLRYTNTYESDLYNSIEEAFFYKKRV